MFTKDKAKIISKTFPGIAKAIAWQWAGVANKNEEKEQVYGGRDWADCTFVKHLRCSMFCFAGRTDTILTYLTQSLVASIIILFFIFC